MNLVSPVLTIAEVSDETVYGAQTPQPLFMLKRVKFNDGSVGSLIRLRFTDADRVLISKGADILIGQSHNDILPPMPLSVKLAMPGVRPELE